MDFRRYSALILLIAVFLAFIPFNYRSHDKIVEIRPIDAYYADLDLDGVEDDIRIYLNVTIIGFGADQLARGVEYGMVLNLFLPSNSKYSYQYTSTDNSSRFSLRVDILNQATEKGWYTLRVAGYYQNLDINKPFTESFHQFDPPGGMTGDDPRFIVTRL